MSPEEKKELLIAMGLSEKAAESQLEYETETWAVTPAFRLLKPLNDRLEFYRGRYRELLEQWQAEGSVENKAPDAAPLLAAGATPEQVEQYAYQRTLAAYEALLYQLDDHRGAEAGGVFRDADFSRCGYARLMELDPDGNPTGRYLVEVHGMLPFSELNGTAE